jgi:hypothetical protein
VQFGYFYPELPESIRNRYPSVLDTISRTDVKFFMADEYVLGFFDKQTNNRINQLFHKDLNISNLYVKNN